MAVASALVLAYGESPAHVYRLLLAGTWGNAYGIGQVLFKATPLVFTGLAVAVPLHAGVFNVGAEGQAVLGSFACALVGAALPSGTPAVIALPVCLAAAFAGGAAAGLVPGLMKAYRGAHEVIVGILLNFIVLALLSDLGKRFYLRESVHTPPVAPGAVLPRASELVPALHGSALSAALVVALLVAALVGWWLQRTIAGFRLRAVGASPGAAQATGIDVARQTVLAMALGGGLAGLVGANAVLGYKHYYEEGFAGGVGFMGIAVALLGRNRPTGIVLAALVFGTLAQGGLAVNAVVPKELVEVLQAVTILAVAVAGAAAWRARAVTTTSSVAAGGGAR
jgi:simple sugar transport system permease protein